MANRYRKPFLNQVIVRIDFPAPINGLSRALSENISKALLPLFPIAEPKKFIAKELQVTKRETKEKVMEGTNWLFHSIDKGKTLTIEPNNINISYKKYGSFEVLKNDLVIVLEAMFNKYPDLQGSRLGLRYINKIELTEANLLDWSDYLDKRLLTMLSIPEDPAKISRAFNTIVLNYGDMMIQFQYGMHNPDFPVPIRKKIFILDYDAYYQGPQNLEEIKQSIDKFHEEIEALFEANITDKLRGLMEIIDA